MMKTRFANNVLIAMVVLSAICAASQANNIAEQSEVVTIRLWDQATITQSEIRLSDVASVSGESESTSAIQSFIISTADSSDQGVTLRSWQIASKLAEAGFAANKIKFTGAARCKVNVVIPQANTIKAQEAKIELVSVDKASKLAGPATLEAKIRRIICRNLTDKGLPSAAKIQIKFNSALKDLLAMTEPPYQFNVNIDNRKSLDLGLVGLKVKIYRDSNLLQTIPVLAQIQIKTPVVIANRTINSKARIGEQDIKTVWRETSKINTKMVIDPKMIIDSRAKRMISPGVIITSDLLEPVPLVRRNQLVTVVYHKGGLEITLVGKAMSNGCRNEMVKIRNERSKEIFQARVIGEGKVTVKDNSADLTVQGEKLAGGIY